MFQSSVSGRGGSVTVRNPVLPDGTPCPLKVYHASPNGSQICFGDWCPDKPVEAPMSGTAEQWGTVVREAVEAAREPEE